MVDRNEGDENYKPLIKHAPGRKFIGGDNS